MALALRADRQRVSDTYARSKLMIAESRGILARLGHTLLVRLVDVTELRVDSFFRKHLMWP